MARTPQIEIDACDPVGFVALRSHVREDPSPRHDQQWIGYITEGESWLLDRPLVVHPYHEVGHNITYAHGEDPGPDAGPPGMVFTLEGLVAADGGFGYFESLSFSAEVICRVRDVPTCTAPLATSYEWTESESERGDTRDSEYEAEFDEDDAGKHLLVEVKKKSRAKGDPADAMGLVLLRAGKHAYAKLLTRKLVALAPAGAGVRGP